MNTKFSLSLFALQLLEVAEMVNPLSEDYPNQTTYYKNIADMIINIFSAIFIELLGDLSDFCYASTRPVFF